MRNLQKTFAVMLAIMMLAMAFSAMNTAFAADEAWEISELKSMDDMLKPIPLLIIKINFDADGDGVDNSGTANNAKETGEQWCHSSDAEWAKLCFSESGKSLLTYYKELTQGKFWFTPVKETSGTADDGIVTVTIPYQHPYKTTGGQSNEDGASRIAALKAAAEYVDFASLDLDGSGSLSYRELAIVYVCGGYEYSSGYGGNAMNVFCVHAHYTTGSGAKINGVTVQGSGFVRVGEYNNASGGVIASIGTLAHELGHFLGAPDLYDVDKKNVGVKWNYASDMTLMSSGSHSRYSGESNGMSPTYMDAYDMVSLGLGTWQTVTDGTYTLYSRQSKVGAHNILKINTPNPSEYYLVENRYGTDVTMFDAIANGAKGIQIWHIDELAISAGRVNSEGEGHDPGIIPMGQNGLSSPYAFYYNDKVATPFHLFDSSKYKFPISGTSYSLLTAEEAANFCLKIEVTSPLGTEMQIKVTGAAELAPTIRITSNGKTTSSITFAGIVKDLNGGNLTDAGLIFSSKADYANDPTAIEVHLKPDEYGKITYTFEGLKSNTKYFCTMFAEGKHGRSEKQTSGYSAAEYVPRDYYVAHMYRGETDAERSYDVKLRPGETIPARVTQTLKKYGFVFGGWYIDENYTERFDLNSTQTELTDITLFAKWIPEESAAILTLANATSRYGMTFASTIGETFVEPDIEARAGYTFGGWFTDEACTEPYDFEKVVEDLDGLTLYVKWIPDEIPETTTTTETVETTTASGTEETTISTETTASTETTDGNEEQSYSTTIILCVTIGFFALAICITIAYKKRKNQEN